MGGCIRKEGEEVSEIGSGFQPPGSGTDRSYLDIKAGSLGSAPDESDLLRQGEDGRDGDPRGWDLRSLEVIPQMRSLAKWRQKELVLILAVLSVLGAIGIGTAIHRRHVAASGPSIIGTSGENCQKHCDCEGGSVMCSTRILWNARNVFKGNPNACAAAHGKVLQHCPCCSVCPLEQVQGCAAPSVATEQGCEKRCNCDGGPVTCRTRVQWSAQHVFPGRPDSCSVAHQTVLRNCPCCAACPLEDVGCGAVSG
mmetsp:Transcript_95638/g.205209  ORF Transcript_95638/g.205209 Transcript_95638/m.205209 type:complete len:253 (-) Transcript_95638:95-853(-)